MSEWKAVEGSLVETSYADICGEEDSRFRAFT